MGTQGVTTQLARDLYGIQRLTEEDREQLRTLILDFFAAAYAGYKQNRAFNRAVEQIIYGAATSSEGADSSIFLQEKKYPAGKAAFMNAVYGHGAELDDGNKKAAGHAGVHLIPAVFALADQLGSTQEDVLIALATGYEAFIRISSAAMPGMVKHGFHSTGMAGTPACAAACARLYHLNAQGIEDAIALATTLSSGLLSYGDSRPAIKPLNPGKAAENGLFAAMLANEGVQGPTEALEGPNGWFHAVTDRVEMQMLKGSDHLLLHDCYFKLYPSCRHTHCGIDAAIMLHGLARTEEIEKVRVYIYPNAIKLAGIKYPKDQDETKFSIYYTLACGLAKGNYGTSDMNPPNLSEEILGIINRTELIPDESMEDRSRGIRGAKVEILLKNGKKMEKTVLVPKGDPENPLTRADIMKKLDACSAGMADDTIRKILSEAILNLGGDDAFHNPMQLTVSQKGDSAL